MFSWLKKRTSTDSVETVTNTDDKVFEHIVALIEDGNNIFITGGAGGIGSEVARVCSKLGARIQMFIAN